MCKRRRSATIATHDLVKMSPPITYLVAPATDITMMPLGWREEVKVQQFLDHVEANKPDRSGGKKAKGVDTTAAVLYKSVMQWLCDMVLMVTAILCHSRYLQYVTREEMAYLRDSCNTVISLPPLTNADNTKVHSLLYWAIHSLCTIIHSLLDCTY